jgi:hypothetical protein
VKSIGLMWWSRSPRSLTDIKEAAALRERLLAALAFVERGALVVLCDRLSAEETALLQNLPELIRHTANEVRGAA